MGACFLVSISNFSRLLVPFGQFTSPIMHALITHRTWKKRWIIPMWSVQIPLLAISMIVLAILIGIEVNAPEDSFGNSQSTVQAWTVVNLVLAVIAFLIDAVELSMYIHNDLSPKLYLCFNTFKFSIWIIPFASIIASLTYSLVVFRTYRKRARTLYEKYSTSEL